MPPSVAFDVTALLGVQTGIGRSVREVRDALGALPAGPRLLPYALGRPRHRTDLPAGAALLPVPMRLLLQAWTRADGPRVDRLVRGAEVLHATAFVAPPTRLPSLVTVHDCAFALHPGTVAGHVHAFDPLLRRAVARGAHVHTTTHQVAGEVQELLGVDLGERLHVVPFGVPRLGPLPVREPGPPYALVLGTLDPRKNVAALVRAFAGAPEDLHLVIAGPDGGATGDVRAAVDALPAGVRVRVRRVPRVDEAERLQLLAGADVLVYPSLYEGFGFPVLEAMTAGVPVVASDIPVLREVSRGAALLVDPRDPDALADALGRARGSDVAAGREVAAGYTWQRTAAGLAQAYAVLAGR